MRHPALFLPALLVLAACGGGGGGGGSTPSVLGIHTNEVQPMSATYRAVFDCTAQVQVTGAPTPIGLSGTYTIENTGDTVVSPLDALQVGTKVANTLVLDVPLAVRTQVPQLPPQVTGTFTEYIRFAPDGSWYSLGYDGTDIWSGSNQTYYAWASPPVKLREPEMAAGQVIQNPTVDMLADDLTTVLLQRQLTRATANATEVLHTPMGMLECYVVTDTETLTIDTAGAPPPPIVYRRWERPDYGVLRLELDAISYTTEYNMQPLTVTLRNVVCVLRSLTP